MNLRVFYLTRRGISDGYQNCAMQELGFPAFQQMPSQIRMCLAPDAVVSSPRCGRVSSQMQSHLAPCSTTSMGVETKLLLLVFVHSF